MWKECFNRNEHRFYYYSGKRQFAVKNRITHKLRRFLAPPQWRSERGQSMVEMALAFPILLLILAGTLEVGKYFNDYLTILDATREAARYAADGDLVMATTITTADCGDLNFYHQTACLALQNISGISFNKDTDDIVVSAMSIGTDGKVIDGSRYPRACSDPTPPNFLPNYCDGLVSSGQEGWSYCEHITQTGCSPAASFFSNDNIEDMLAQGSGGPATGIVIVEIYRLHRQFLGLIPPGLPFLPQEVVMHAYTMMPLPSAAAPPSYAP
jgi:hypothetical protein